ncbi:MAG: hypothetical protein CMJ84_05915 [Planctomycetes bacterium]|jgi:cytosine/adenosine deaminase-related metal-dependent hydrolase|nr:hypothetical protein [Planctomycetota bacterium]MDP6409588.1 amidohydrolase family protein [Planctomycetota bacterium]
MEPIVVTARGLLCEPDRLLEGGGVVVHGGRVRGLLDSRVAVGRAGFAVRDLGDVLLTPGMVNAHAHLELGALGSELPADGGFVSWVEALIARKSRVDAAGFARAVARGVERLLAGGTTCVGDVDSTGAAWEICGRTGVRARVYREVLDAGDESRTAGALEELPRPPAEECESLQPGIAPHAPYTVSPALFAACGELMRERGLACTVHWAETEQEEAWVERGEGDFARLLTRSPGVSGLDAIEAAGLLGSGTSLVHANHARPEERERIARAGAVVVHCPGTHAFFGRAPFDFSAWTAAGVELALGTDSLASNDTLDMGDEVARVRAEAGLEPAAIWAMATLGGARAVGLAGAVGALVEGAWADLVAWPWSGGDRDAALDALTSGGLRPRSVSLAGREFSPRSS